MGTFITDGTSVLPPVKSDARPATVPPAADEWAAADANKVRQALLDLRTEVLQMMQDITFAGSSVIQAAGPGFVITRPIVPENSVTASDSIGWGVA